MNLEDIKAHPDFPFSEFQNNDLQFLMLELYWAELFRSAALTDQGSALHSDQWQVRYPADRDEGNPILSLINRGMLPPRALRVIQRFNTEQLPALILEDLAPVEYRDDVYVPFVPDLTGGAIDDDGQSPIEELVISSDVSPPCEALFSALIQDWCVKQVGLEKMQTTLDAFWVKVRKNLIQLG